MRLINVKTLELEEFTDNKTPDYAILSHRWGSAGSEIAFQDLQTLSPAQKHSEGYAKITNCCAQASRDGLDWAWLQELLAPPDLEFFSQSWTTIGTKRTLSDIISRITKIPAKILGGGSLSSVSIATRMSWAANRVTTRLEDVAYSLLGIFDVHMPLLYGEGHKAFIRLQEQIMKESDDHSLFAWKNLHVPTSTSWTSEVPKIDLLADAPAAFADAANIIPFRNMKASEPYALTNKGVRMSVILIPDRGRAASEPFVIAVLECRLDGPFEGLLGITLVRSSKGSDQYARYMGESEDPKVIGLDRIIGQPSSTIFVRKSAIVPDFSLAGRFVVRISAESGYRVLQAYPDDCWNSNSSTMATNDQGFGILIFERPRDRHFVVFIRSLVSTGYVESEACRVLRDRLALRQALKPYYGVFEHLVKTCSQKTAGPLKEGDAVSNSIGSLMGRRNVLSGLTDSPNHGRVSCRSADLFGQQMFIIDVS
ncbi:hypothetical protein BLS_001731 [Venturia inaequalis]|uniref:DUF8212 domain-containing protein n=1 Tax=Venturia inaequalis TaxID=5025 RepID=A0A8H3YJ44_VENIN|nr:hypothetical protein BLS_001731 [Venturia inaequalis]